MAPLTPFTLAAALKAIGVAEVFTGDPTLSPGAVGAMTSIGATEGTITFAAPQTMNPLTAPELTGETPHQQTTTLGAVTITAPVILGDPTLYTRISPVGAASGGFSIPQPVKETSVLLIPRAQVGGGLSYTTTNWVRVAGNGVAAATGAPAAPVNAVWLWRATVSFGDLPYSYGNGGKVIATITFHAMFDVTKPEGHKVYTIGDPYAATNISTGVSSPIAVLPTA